VQRQDLQWKVNKEGDIYQQVYEEQIQDLTGNIVCRDVKYSGTIIQGSLRGDYPYLIFSFGDNVSVNSVLNYVHVYELSPWQRDLKWEIHYN
jgi:hypothetical protein